MMTPQEHAQQIATRIVADVLEKYDKGQKEHGGFLWQKPGVLKMLRQELLDGITYEDTLRYQIQSALEYLTAGDIESGKKVLTDILGDPTDK